MIFWPEDCTQFLSEIELNNWERVEKPDYSEIIKLLDDDKFAASFQSLGQYRKHLKQVFIDKMEQSNER